LPCGSIGGLGAAAENCDTARHDHRDDHDPLRSFAVRLCAPRRGCGVKKTDIGAAWQGLANCKGCGIRETALFADLTQGDFNLIHLPIDEIVVAPGAALYHVGDEPQALYTVRSGLVKLVQYLPNGGQRIVRLLRAGDTAGLEAALGEPYRHTAIAVHPVLTCRIPRAVIQRLSEETQHLHQQLLRRWHQAVERADAFLVELGTGSARARVARLFLTLIDEQDDCDFFGREDVGAVLGITTETASRVVAELKRQGVLDESRPNRFHCDRAALRALADGP